MTAHELSPHGFDPATGRWRALGPVLSEGRPVMPAGGIARPLGQVSDTLGVATYNVFFAELYQAVRWQALLDQVEHCQADVIAFQEVTFDFLDLVLETPWVRDQYVITDIDGASFTGYGVVLLSRVVPHKLSLHLMPSAMGRRLLVAHYAGGLAVATIHLESLRPNRTVRAQQFAQILDILGEFDHAVLMGDMNFCAEWSENQRVPDDYVDMWSALHPDDRGWTYDTAINLTARDLCRSRKQVRYDRIFVRSTEARWQARHIERLGTEPIAGYPRLFPSDHFGLYGRLRAGSGALKRAHDEAQEGDNDES